MARAHSLHLSKAMTNVTNFPGNRKVVGSVPNPLKRDIQTYLAEVVGTLIIAMRDRDHPSLQLKAVEIMLDIGWTDKYVPDTMDVYETEVTEEDRKEYYAELARINAEG